MVNAVRFCDAPLVVVRLADLMGQSGWRQFAAETSPQLLPAVPCGGLAAVAESRVQWCRRVRGCTGSRTLRSPHRIAPPFLVRTREDSPLQAASSNFKLLPDRKRGTPSYVKQVQAISLLDSKVFQFHNYLL